MKGIIDDRIRRFLNAVRKPFRMVIDRVTTGKGVKKVSGEGLSREPVEDAELFQHYGFCSCPPGGTMAVVVPLGGVSSHAMIVATEHAAFGVDLATGESAMYHKEGHFVHMKNGRIVQVDCDTYRVRCKRYEVTATEEANVETPKLATSHVMEVNGALVGKGGLALSNEGGESTATIDGKIDVSEDVIAGGVSVAGHHHKDSRGGETGAPIR